MKEFEEALKRARENVAVPPVREREIEPVARRAAEGTLPAPETSARPAADLSHLPVLKANIGFFRENFGSRGGDSAAVDGAFRILRTRVLEAMKLRGGHILGITSPAAGAGKTVTAIHLALACARRAEQVVVLADFDYRRPAAAQYLDAAGFRPSLDYFRGQGAITDYLYRNEAGNLAYLLNDRPTEMSAEHLASSQFTQGLESLGKLSDNVLVICDLPPMTGCDDTLAVLPQLDGVLLVVASGESRFAHVEEALSLIPKQKLIGTVLNKAAAGSTAYEYY